MDLALHCHCAYPLIKLGFMRAKSANHLHVRDTHSLPFALRFEQSLSRTTINGDRSIWFQEKGGSSYTSMGRSKKGCVCCKKPSDRRTSNPSKSNQEEIISLLKRIQSSISKGESRGVEEEKNSDESSKEKPLTKAILDVLEKSRKKTEGDTSVKEKPPKRQVELPRPPSSFVKRTPLSSSASGPRGKLPVSNSDKALGKLTKKEEKASLIETMKLAELKEVAKNRGIKGYSKLRKSELLELIRSS
ncbi:Rho termination factor [Arabidopsis thaliana]|uniref:Rho termination factor n=1 Tax=Arabidopsis thaliana TaxID=3702 RepID=F4JRN0_ARATH|nr:Rho termination factor [Arabidopsis thaliana]AEE84083.1 Rho termination factor [Arabidopsis thaliana]|eukprot:NP_193609.2 Rho termination factor [Arabidopsis thaliana]